MTGQPNLIATLKAHSNRWASTTLTDIRHPGHCPRKDVQNGDHGKEEAPSLCQRAERSIGQVARDFDLTETNVRTWGKPAEIDRGERPGLTTEERDELAKLRRENRFLRADRFSPPSNERSSTPARGPQDRDFDAISSSTSRVGTTPADCIRLSATSVPPNTKLPIHNADRQAA